MHQVDDTVAVVDARPFIPADENSPWADAERKRDEFAAVIDRAAKSHNLSVLVLKSQPGVYPIAVTMTAWSPEQDDADRIVTRRESLSISIDVNPYLEWPLAFDVAVKGRKSASEKLWRLDDCDVADLTLFALGIGRKPSIFTTRFEAVLYAFLPFLRPRNRLISLARPRRLTLPTGLGALALLGGVMALATFETDPATAGPAIIVSLLLVISAGWLAARRATVYSLVKRPGVSPRSLVFLDSWQTSLPGVGAVFDELVARVESALRTLDPAIILHWEVYQFRTPYSFGERRRLTLTKDQAVIHVHLYPFTEDAFVGWDGFLNAACWAETVPVSQSVSDGKRVEFRSLTVGSYQPTSVDLVELNALSELVHRRMTNAIKMFVKEKAIEADIDFAIIRGDRSAAIDGSGAASKRRERPWSSRMAPVAKS